MFGVNVVCALVLFPSFSLRAAPLRLRVLLLLSSARAGFASSAANAGRDALETTCAAQETAALTVRKRNLWIPNTFLHNFKV